MKCRLGKNPKKAGLLAKVEGWMLGNTVIPEGVRKPLLKIVPPGVTNWVGKVPKEVPLRFLLVTELIVAVRVGNVRNAGGSLAIGVLVTLVRKPFGTIMVPVGFIRKPLGIVIDRVGKPLGMKFRLGTNDR